ASNTRTREILEEMSGMLKSTKGVSDFSAIAGLNVINFSIKSNSGTFFVSLKPWGERKDKDQQVEAIVGALRGKFSAIKDANVVIVQPPAIPGLGQTGGFSFILQQRESTDDIKGFESTVQNFLAEVRKRPEI